jgi:hypothetical protein
MRSAGVINLSPGSQQSHLKFDLSKFAQVLLLLQIKRRPPTPPISELIFVGFNLLWLMMYMNLGFCYLFSIVSSEILSYFFQLSVYCIIPAPLSMSQKPCVFMDNSIYLSIIYHLSIHLYIIFLPLNQSIIYLLSIHLSTPLFLSMYILNNGKIIFFTPCIPSLTRLLIILNPRKRA